MLTRCLQRSGARFVGLAFVTLGCSSGGGSTPTAGSAAVGGEVAGSGSGGVAAGSGGSTAGQSAGGSGDSGRSGQSGASGNAGGAGSGAAASGGAGGLSGGAGASGSGGSAGNAAVPATETLYVSGYGPDINVFELDTKTGALKKRSSANGGKAPSYLAFAPNLQFAYAVNEGDGSDSQVVAFSIEAHTGKLTKLNSAASGGEGAPHLAVHPSGKWVMVAHYNSGQTSVLPIDSTGRVGAAGTPDKGPNGGCENAHQVVFDRSGDYVLVPCLGSNYVIQYKFKDGVLSYNTPATVSVAGGPRHIAFDPEQHYAYVLSELESLITSFRYDAATGKLSDPQTINSYDQTAGASAHIVVHASGKWLYASNRGENSLGLFSIDAGGRPNAVSFVKDMIATPRDFSVDPSGRWLILANQAGAQNLLVFQVDPTNGQLTRSSVVDVGGQPAFTQAVVLPP